MHFKNIEKAWNWVRDHEDYEDWVNKNKYHEEMQKEFLND